MKDFFISYNLADKSWAEWIASQLADAGYTIVFQAWDFRPGSNFVLEMQKAATEAQRTLAVLSPDYLKSRYTQPEWAAAFAQDPTGEKRTLIPVRVRECELKGLLPQIFYIDLVGKDEPAAQQALLEGIKVGRLKPTTPPAFPETSQHTTSTRPCFPGALPSIWNVPHLRNPHFTGREEIMQLLRTALTSQQAATLTHTAIHGLGGVGKTQLAAEYAYRYKDDYQIIWWLRAEEPTTLATNYAGLAQPLNLREKNAKEQSVVVAAVKDWLNHNKGWLLIFDNAQLMSDIRDYLPQSSLGHVLVTTRNVDWDGVANAFQVKPFDPQESVSFLCHRIGQNDEATARALADELGHLPLALEQAAAYIKAAAKSLTAYLRLFQKLQRKILERGKPSTDYPYTVATTWELAFQRVKAQTSAAADLLNLCAFLAPDDIPRQLLYEGISQVAEEFQTLSPLADELAFDEAVMALRQYSLLEATSDTLSVHRLVQAVSRDRLPKAGRKRWAEAALRLLNHIFPVPSDDVRFWPSCAALLPHAQAVIAHGEKLWIVRQETARLLNQMGVYLQACAAYTEAEQLFRRSREINEKQLGPEHPEVATSLNNLALLLLESQGKYVEAESLFLRSVAISEKQLGLEHPNVATSLNNLAILLKSQDKYAESVPLYSRSLKIREKHLGPEHPDVAIILDNLAELLISQGKYADAELLNRRALAIFEKKLGPEHLHVAISLNTLAGLLESQGKYAEAELIYRRSLVIREKQLNPEHPDIASSLNNLAALLKSLGQYAKAESLHRRALMIREKQFGPEHSDVAQSLNNLGLSLELQGKYIEAESLFRRALEIWEKQLGPEHSEVATGLNNLATLLDSQGRYAEAELIFRRSLAIREKQLGPEHPDVAVSIGNLAGILETQSNFADAEPLRRRALEIHEKCFGVDHPYVATGLNNLATLLDSQGRYAEAEPLYRRSLAIRKKQLGPKHPDVATSLGNLVGLLQSQGKYAEAEPLYRRSLAIREKQLGPEHPDVATSLNNLAGLLYAQRKYAEAESLFRRSLAILETKLGPEHPHAQTARNNLALLLEKMRSI